jgi:hypothetical protein
MHFRQFYIGCLAHACHLIGGGSPAQAWRPRPAAAG